MMVYHSGFSPKSRPPSSNQVKHGHPLLALRRAPLPMLSRENGTSYQSKRKLNIAFIHQRSPRRTLALLIASTSKVLANPLRRSHVVSGIAQDSRR